MSPQSVVLSLLIIFFSFGLCLGFYIEDKHNEKKYSSKRIVNVNDYGAIPNDGSDNTEAFEKAWDEACSRGARLVVPRGSVYHLKPIKFSGPCKPHTAFRVYGTIKAWHDISVYKDRGLWIMFDNLNHFVVNGGGVFNGDGRKWWKNSCKVNKTLGGSGYAKNIKFMNIAMRNVTNPIIINQSYCDRKEPCPEQSTAVKVSKVVYRNITGTSASKVAIKFECSKEVPCEGIYLEDVTLTSENRNDTIATCNNVEYSKRGELHPECSS
ncbi:unnamed protein product [Lupinus luteus]|uniref:Polygalacturonase n=1 Tax=Lupinus luteus TaxID=3873 RepID=A0AAV1XZ24_LUPLU